MGSPRVQGRQRAGSAAAGLGAGGEGGRKYPGWQAEPPAKVCARSQRPCSLLRAVLVPALPLLLFFPPLASGSERCSRSPEPFASLPGGLASRIDAPLAFAAETGTPRLSDARQPGHSAGQSLEQASSLLGTLFLFLSWHANKWASKKPGLLPGNALVLKVTPGNGKGGKRHFLFLALPLFTVLTLGQSLNRVLWASGCFLGMGVVATRVTDVCRAPARLLHLPETPAPGADTCRARWLAR